MYEYEKMILLVVIMQNLSDLLTWLNELSNAPTYTHTTQKCSCPFSHHFERFFSCLQFRILKNQLFCIGHNRLAQHHGGDSSNDTFHAFCVAQQLAAALLQHLKKNVCIMLIKFSGFLTTVIPLFFLFGILRYYQIPIFVVATKFF